jgi:hypothetical protein
VDIAAEGVFMIGGCSCGENRPAAMTWRGCCHECAARADGRPVIENHHVLGRAQSGISVDLPINWHPVLHAPDKSRDEVLLRPGDNPVHQIASAIMRGVDIARAFADYGETDGSEQWAIDLARIMAGIGEYAANWLLVLAGWLEDRLGPEWFKELPPWEP